MYRTARQSGYPLESSQPRYGNLCATTVTEAALPVPVGRSCYYGYAGAGTAQGRGCSCRTGALVCCISRQLCCPSGGHEFAQITWGSWAKSRCAALIAYNAVVGRRPSTLHLQLGRSPAGKAAPNDLGWGHQSTDSSEQSRSHLEHTGRVTPCDQNYVFEWFSC